MRAVRPTTPVVVPGHCLVSEGAPHSADGRAYIHRDGTGGTGHAKCSCGALSEELTSGVKRKSWHREHKAEVLVS